MRAPRLLLVCLLVLAVATGALVLAAGDHGARREALQSRQVAHTADSETALALAVLRRWDRRRAAAWARQDPKALTRLYVAGSTAGRRDQAMLAAYASRGLRVRSMHRQVLAARVLLHRAGQLRIEVTDRLVDAVAVGRGVRAALPTAGVHTRLITLIRVSRSWRVAGVGRR